MKLTLQQMREKLLNEANGKNNQPRENNQFYPFWDIPENAQATVRFLPDGNQDNPWFWVERQMLRIPFTGVVGGDLNKQITMQVPCMKMFNKTCPVQEAIKDWWNDEAMVPHARTYYVKKSFIYQGFVVNSPLTEANTPENPIRKFMINKKLHEMIKASLIDPEIENLPVDYNNGLDFKLIKTRQGQWADYGTSSFSRKERALSTEELAAIEKHGLNDLSSALPKEPTDDMVKQIFQMFEDSVNNEPFDQSKFKDFKLYGSNDKAKDDTATEEATTKTVVSVAKAQTAPEPTKAAEVVTKEKEETKADTKPAKNFQDVLEQLKKKKAAQSQA